MKFFLKSLFVLIVILSSSISFPQQTVIIDASTTWQNTGITVNQGDYVLLFAQGSWSYSGTAVYGAFVGPEGAENWHSAPEDFLVQNVNQFSLVGKIGDTGTPFGIGSFYIAPNTESGTLFLSMNDRPSYFGDNYGYLAVGIFINTIVGILDHNNFNTPNDSRILQNYPNPFNPSTTIEYQISKAEQVSIVIYDINGQVVRDVISDYQNPGYYSEVWDGKNNSGMRVSSGTYFYQLQVGDFIQSKKMILIK